MTQEEVFNQINTAAQAEGHDAETTAKKAGREALPAPSPEARAFLDRFETDFGAFVWSYTFPNGQEMAFTFPCSITELQALSVDGPAFATSDEVPEGMRDLGEDLLGTAWIMGRTNTKPGLAVSDFLRMSQTAGRGFFHLAPHFVKAFQRAMSLQPMEDIKQGKGA